VANGLSGVADACGCTWLIAEKPATSSVGLVLPDQPSLRAGCGSTTAALGSSTKLGRNRWRKVRISLRNGDENVSVSVLVAFFLRTVMVNSCGDLADGMASTNSSLYIHLLVTSHVPGFTVATQLSAMEKMRLYLPFHECLVVWKRATNTDTVPSATSTPDAAAPATPSAPPVGRRSAPRLSGMPAGTTAPSFGPGVAMAG